MFRRIAEFLVGQVGAQLISIAALSALAAIVSGEALATYGLALALGSVVGANISLRIELAILASEPDRLAAMTTGALVLGLLPGVSGLILAIHAGEFGPIFAGLSYGSLVSVSGTMQAILIVQEKSRLAGILLLARSSILAIAVVGVAIAGYADSEALTRSLALASVAWMAVGALVAAKAVGIESPAATVRAVSESRGAWMPLLGQSLTSSVSLNLPYVVVSQQYPAAFVASYLLAEKAVKLPIALFSYSLRSHLIPFFRSDTAVDLGGDFSIPKWTFAIWIAAFSAIIAGSLVIACLPISLTAGSTSDVAGTVQVMSAWAASSVSLALSSAYLQARGASTFLFRNQTRELLGKLLVLGAILLAEPPYYIAVTLIFAWPFASNLMVVNAATRMQRGDKR